MYKSTTTLPIYNFYRIIQTSDFRYLYKEFKDEDDLKIKKRIAAEEESKIFDIIFYEYCDLISDHNLRIQTRKQFLVEEWSITYDLICEIISRYKLNENIEVLLLLAEIDSIYSINFEENIPSQVSRLERKMLGLKNKIKIYKSKIVNSSKLKDDDDNEDDFDLELEAINIELGLDLKRAILIKETSVSYYFKLKKLLLQKQENYGKNQNSRSRKPAGA